MIRPYHSFRNNLRIALLSLSLDVLPLAVSFLLVLATLALPFALATFALALACHCVNVQCLGPLWSCPHFRPTARNAPMAARTVAYLVKVWALTNR